MDAQNNSKIILRKNPDGTTTKVLVKKVLRKVKVRSKSASQTQKEAPAPSSPKDPQKGPQKTPQKSPYTKSSAFKKKPLSSTHRSFRGNREGQGHAKASHTSVGVSRQRPTGKSQKTGKILITKKKKEKTTGTFGVFNYVADRTRNYSNRKGKKEDAVLPDKLESKERLDEYHRSMTQKETDAKDDIAGVPSRIEIPQVISIKDLALKLNLKVSQILKRLFNYGVMDLNVNDTIDAESAAVVCADLNCEVKVVSLLEQSQVEDERGRDEDYKPRAPVVAVMGHVDHGKTTLLDTLRNAQVATSESGGITQHIGAYHVVLKEGSLLFLDTPGHASFAKMRDRSAQVTDMVLLVVAATEGVKPQTIEALKHIKKAAVPMVVAVNKMDVAGANLNKVVQELASHGILTKQMGGDVDVCGISALKKTGMDTLLKTLVNTARDINFTGNDKVRSNGYVIESKIEKGRGNVGTVVIKNGHLKVGDPFICGSSSGRVRAMFDDVGRPVKYAGPSRVVEVLGFDGQIMAGDRLQGLATEKEARYISQLRKQLIHKHKASQVKKVTLSNLFDKIKEQKIAELKVVLKGDVYGTVEAIKETLDMLKNDEVKIAVIHASTGGISENDIGLAASAGAMVIGFKVKPNNKAKKLAEAERVTIKMYQVVYELIEDLTQKLETMLSQESQEDIIGKITVKEIYKISGAGKIAGCVVSQGKVTDKSDVRLYREGQLIHTGTIRKLKRFKENVKSVSEGMECGIQLKDFQQIEVGDLIECYHVTTIRRKLDIDLPLSQ